MLWLAEPLTNPNCSLSWMNDLFIQLLTCSGYMAPEYVVRGKLTEKADVYSFGVLVIEVICGKRNNNAISQNSFSVLQKLVLGHTSFP